MNRDTPIWPAGTLAVLAGINLLNYLDRYVLPAVLTPIKAELHLSDARLGALGSAFMLGYFLTSPVFGYLGDRLARKHLIAVGVVVWSIGTVFSGRAGSYGELVLFRILVGVGEASYATISPAWIADLYARKWRNNALSIFYAAIPVGSALGYLAGGIIAARWGWRSAFYLAGAPGLVLGLGLLRLREPARGASDPDDGIRAAGPRGLRAYAGLFRIRPYVLVVAGYVAQTFALGGFAFWAPTFLYRVHGMSVQSAAVFFGESLVMTGLVATVLGGLLATAWQRRSPAGYARVLALSSLAAVPLSLAAFLLPDATPAKAALIGAMFLIFIPTGPVNTLILESVPTGMRASAMAASIFAIHLLGDLESPNLVGIISDRLGGDLQKAVLWTLPVALAVSAVFWSRLALDSESRNSGRRNSRPGP
jgi:predicted MFS family arabinose efflux permease